MIRYAQSCSDRNNTYLQCFTQIHGVTTDNASNNDKMIEHLTMLIENFPRAANQMRCFMHILNLIAKNVLQQFEAPKLKGGKVLDEAARELAMVLDDLEGLDDDDVALKSGDDEDGGEGGDNVDDDVVDDEEDGLLDE